ncbi:hypothetical protein [Streptomyces sp. N35]|uniref:hypothetical protein n=1 Tax=Streptomyces sp. N35 TaxID=2795730 RepID=UPI0018F31AE0|nr:hypothetical protein [Streptomyces sp. N35]
MPTSSPTIELATQKPAFAAVVKVLRSRLPEHGDDSAVASMGSVRGAVFLALYRHHSISVLRETHREAFRRYTVCERIAEANVAREMPRNAVSVQRAVDRANALWPAVVAAAEALEAAQAAMDTDRAAALALLTGLSSDATWGDVIRALCMGGVGDE